MEKITEYLIQSTVHDSQVKAWEEKVMLPTYEIGTEEKNPIFLEKRVYQGSSGSVYPYPVVEHISDEKVDKEYRALFIENEYIKVMILPELGGRIQMAYDKVKSRHFVYYNQVIKPALVGLTGPWISGGIEFNWPQHHRPSTYLPIDYQIETFEDGSMTVWCSEVERMYRTKGMMGFTLYPGKSYIEVKAKVYNRTSLPQNFLWWANPAVVVNDDYYSVFPPDTNAVFDHGKRDVSSFPIATGTYYKADYSAGVDISRYKNIPVPTSYMARNSKYDFIGGYDEGVSAGMLHVADHHTSVGKKQWTWGNGDFGQMWDRNLTDEDGPYIELMTGQYCDNQPDFTWLQPYEEKSWVQYFMPYQNVGMVKNASKDAVVNLERVSADKVKVTVYASAVYANAHVQLADEGKTYLDTTVNISPAAIFTEVVDCDCPKMELLKLTVQDEAGKTLVSYQAEAPSVKPLPDKATAAKFPKEIGSVEQLFLTGQHLEQYHHATYSPMDYYLEGLAREETDIRCNNAVGLLLMRRGKFADAKKYFEQAVKTQTQRNPNPYDGEPYYNLGWCEKMLGHADEAYDAFFKSTWNAAWQDAGYMNLAQIDMQRKDYEVGLDHIDRSLNRNWSNHKARQLKAAFFRKVGKYVQANQIIEESLKMDLFNVGCLFESYLVNLEQGHQETAAKLKGNIQGIIRKEVHSYLEYVLDYSNAGLYEEAQTLMNFLLEDTEVTYPMPYYAMGYISLKNGETIVAKQWFEKAESMPSDYCFPNKLEEVLMLQAALDFVPGTKALYYLGNFWFSARQYADAVACWEASVELDDTFPTAHRNLALAYYNKQDDKALALASLEKAFALDPSDSRILMELDQLYKKLQHSHCDRLDVLKKHASLVEQRDDLNIELITLHNQLGEYQTAYDLLSKRQFHPWEGGEGKVIAQYVLCRLELTRQALRDGQYDVALHLLKETEQYPHNLGEGKLATVEENDIHYYMGCAYEGLGDTVNAKACFEKATVGSDELTIAFFYNDQQPDKMFYRGLAWRKLGREDKAKGCFYKLLQHGEKHLFDDVKIDYFAVSLPDLLVWEDDLNIRNQVHCNLVRGLGYLGLGQYDEATEVLELVTKTDGNHQLAQSHLVLCTKGLL